MKINLLSLAIVLGGAAVLVACVLTDHTQAGNVVGLLTTLGGALAPQLLAAKRDATP